MFKPSHTLLPIVLAGTLCGHAQAQWTNDPSANTPVVVKPGDQTVVKADAAPDGASWTGWFDFAPTGVELRVQRLNAEGVPTFAPEGLLVSDHPQNTSVVDWDLRADDQGNCMLTFVDIRSGPDNDVHAYLIAPDGSFLWGPDGVTVSDNTEFEADPRIARLSGGDYAVVWPRFDVAPGLVMQRISPAGVKAFPGDGVLIAFSGTQEPAFHEMIPTPDNGLIVSYVRDITSFFSARHVMAVRVDADAQPVWGGGSTTVVSNATSVPIAHRPRLIPDTAGGAIIAWHDTRDGDFDCYVQRVTPSGGFLYAANGQPASSEPGRQQLDPAVALAPSGDVMMFFRNLDGAQNQQGINVQRFDAATGARTLGNAGANLAPFNGEYKGPPRAVAHEAGAAGVYDRQPNLGSTQGTLEMLFAAEDGSLVSGAPFPVSTAPSSKGRLNLVRSPDGRMLAAWSDARNGSEDIYAQRINADGSLGGQTCAADLTGDGELNVFDLFAYLALYNAGDPAADLTGEGDLNVFDLFTYLVLYQDGCP